VAPTSSLPAVPGAVGPIVGSKSAIGDASAYAREDDPDKAITVRLNLNLAERYYNRGIVNGQNGRYDKAIADFTEAIRLNPKLAQAYYSRGVTYWCKGNHERAVAEFNEAIRLDPKLAVAYYGRGCACLYYGQKANAEGDFAQAKRLGYTSPKPSSTSIIQMSLSILGGATPWP
jgi:tetratricopeptide (TPR) repeat protein